MGTRAGSGGQNGRVAEKFDPESEGLLDGVEGDARDRLESLLRRLYASGVGVDELREAIDGRRLALIASERALSGGERYSTLDVAERVGVEPEVLESQWRALGLAVGDPEEKTKTRADLDAADRLRELLDSGLDPDAVEQTSRVMAMALAQVAASHREVAIEVAGADEDPGAERSLEEEVEIAERLEALTTTLVPLVGPSLEHLYRIQLREQIRNAIISLEARRQNSGSADTTAIAFADLVGFTRLGEELAPEAFGEITLRFAELAAGVAGGPVRLVKMIGDAAMFSSPQPEELAVAVLQLLEAVEDEGGEFPSVRAGMSWGPAVSRGGDLYGRAVNQASRLTGAARPGSLLVAGEDAKSLDEDERLRLSDAGHKRLKGIEGAVHVYRCRPAPKDEDVGEAGA